MVVTTLQRTSRTESKGKKPYNSTLKYYFNLNTKHEKMRMLILCNFVTFKRVLYHIKKDGLVLVLMHFVSRSLLYLMSSTFTSFIGARLPRRTGFVVKLPGKVSAFRFDSLQILIG